MKICSINRHLCITH